ncbi:MAG TPA: glycosyltransferase family 1 protein [Prolixibacteraceae bacterium]|nr:glycosyltransferase family 1 protein [Prolixibacteraceae bacterium]
MKIGFDAKRAFNNTAGLGNFSRSTIDALASHNPDDRFFLFHPGKSKSSLFVTPKNSIVIQPDGLWWKIFRNAWRRLKISTRAKELNIDLYHGLSHELPDGIEKTNVKSVVTIHDLIYVRYPGYFRKTDQIIYDYKFRHACEVATKIHAISQQTKLDLIAFFHVPENKIEVIYQAVNPMFFHVVPEAKKLAVLKKYRLPEKFLLSVGTIEQRKNLVTLLEAMLVSNIKLPLVVVGKPTDYKKKVQQMISQHPGKLKVHFLSGVINKELQAIYQSAIALVYPSIFEGFGLPVAEAQASGCPVITSNVSSLPEAGGNAALYCDPEKPEEIGRAIENLLSDQSLRKTLIANGKLNAQRFTQENYARQLRQLYNTVLND